MKVEDKERHAITFLVNEDGATIELHDRISSITLAKAKLTASQLVKALSRLSYTPCTIEMRGLDKLGKRMVVDKLEFEMPDYEWPQRDKVAGHEADRVCPEGWQHDNYFGSQGSLFHRDGKEYARVTIRRWEDEDGGMD